MKTASKFRKNRRSTRTTNKKRGGNAGTALIVKHGNEKNSSNTGHKVKHSDVDRFAEERREAEKKEREAKIEAERIKAKKIRIEKCKEHETLHDWHHHECGGVHDDDNRRFLDFYEDTEAGQKIVKTWPEICPGQQTRNEFYNNGCGSWKKEGQFYTWGDTEAGKKENEKRMNECMNINTEVDFDNKSCYHLDKDGKSLKWFDTYNGKKDLKAKQESCMTDENMNKSNFEKYGCDKLGHDWKESAAYKKIEREQHITDINIIKYNLFGNLNEVLKYIKEYTKVATNPKNPVGKEVYQLIYENKHPKMAWSGLSWKRIRNTVEQQVNDFVNNQEENEQNKIRKYVENNGTYLKHNKHIADLITEKIEELTKEMEGAKEDVKKIKQQRIKDLNNVLPEKFFITLSEEQYKESAVTEEEKEEIEKELEQELNKGVEANNLELVEETRGGKRKRKRNRKTKKSKKSKRRTRRRHK